MSRCVGRAIDCVVPARSTVAVGVPNSVSPPLDARYEVPVSEKTLPGGNTVGAVRIGDVVHKQASPCTPTVHALLRHLEDAGVDGRFPGRWASTTKDARCSPSCPENRSATVFAGLRGRLPTRLWHRLADGFDVSMT